MPPNTSTSSPPLPFLTLPLLSLSSQPQPSHAPPPSSSDNHDHAHNSYTNLLTHLHPSPPTVLEIDILPSSSGLEIQYSATDHALGIPKRCLIAAFLVARGLFFAGLSSSRSGHGSAHANTVEGQGEGDEGGHKEEEIFKATSVMLLFEPNHTTAINFRKRCILHHYPSLPASSSSSDDNDGVITTELIWLDSLLTSPLPKHTKSPTLWAHRWWLLRSFILPTLEHGRGRRVGADDRMPALRAGGGGDHQQGASDGRRLLEREVGVVMRAGERHPRNYYAWNYAREVWRMVQEVEGVLDKGEEAAGGCWRKRMVEKVRRWCFAHPRDVSGWSFLVWLLEDCIKMSGGCVGGGEDIVRDIVMATEEFVAKYGWRGESIEGFLKAVRRLKTSE